MVLEVPEQFPSLLALCFHSTCVRNKATLANIPNASGFDSNASRLKSNASWVEPSAGWLEVNSSRLENGF